MKEARRQNVLRAFFGIGGKGMRLFIAVGLPDSIKEKLYRASVRLKEQSEKGTFSRRGNYHITLAFIGETERSDDVCRIMDALSFQRFDVETGGAGRFSSREGDIYWAGVGESRPLSQIADRLSNDLRAAGFKIDSRSFKPHITLGRRVVTRRGFDRAAFSASLSPMRFTVSRISLMKSERIDGRLTYTEIYSVSERPKDAL